MESKRVGGADETEVNRAFTAVAGTATVYVVTLTYKVSLPEADKFFSAHIEYIEHYHAKGIYLISGRREPRSGGVLIAANCSRQDIEAIVAADPYNLNHIADFSIIDFIPTRFDPCFSKFM
jgi:uncharacterized protein YciI